MESPRITVYGKILDNKDQSLIRDYREWRQNQIWHYGNVNGVKGGESDYVIEFDIWNNEPNFNGLSGKEAVKDAENVRFAAWNDSTMTSSTNLSYAGIGFVNVRCVTDNLKSEFTNIFGAKGFYDVQGNVGFEKGILSGQLGGDHAVMQTKIVIPDVIASAGEPLPEGDVNFILTLTYEYE